ncbi:MAG: hypothetical protein ACPGVB_04400 [Chitinophagales bacterium]
MITTIESIKTIEMAFKEWTTQALMEKFGLQLFFHEYKKEKGSADDPIGQLLAAMMVGQKLNDNQKPVYGAYVVGRNWFFVVLEGKKYCINNNFSVTQKDELEGIYRNLVAIKGIIEEELV